MNPYAYSITKESIRDEVIEKARERAKTRENNSQRKEIITYLNAILEITGHRPDVVMTRRRHRIYSEPRAEVMYLLRGLPSYQASPYTFDAMRPKTQKTENRFTLQEIGALFYLEHPNVQTQIKKINGYRNAYKSYNQKIKRWIKELLEFHATKTGGML